VRNTTTSRRPAARVLAVIGAAVLSGLLAACGASPDSTAVAPAGAALTAAPGVPAPGPGKVSANSSSEDVIAAALKAAGVTSPKRWAAEVVEYRPYPTDDLNLARLRENLAKYKPGQQTVDKIVSALQP
jgi:hypothetical protein